MSYKNGIWTEDKYNGFKLSYSVDLLMLEKSEATVEQRGLYLYASSLNSKLRKSHKTWNEIKIKRVRIDLNQGFWGEKPDTYKGEKNQM